MSVISPSNSAFNEGELELNIHQQGADFSTIRSSESRSFSVILHFRKIGGLPNLIIDLFLCRFFKKRTWSNRSKISCNLMALFNTGVSYRSLKRSTLPKAHTAMRLMWLPGKKILKIWCTNKGMCKRNDHTFKHANDLSGLTCPTFTWLRMSMYIGGEAVAGAFWIYSIRLSAVH